MEQMELCLKPGGIILSVLGDGMIWSEDPTKLLPMAKFPDEIAAGIEHPLLSESGSWYHRMVYGKFR